MSVNEIDSGTGSPVPKQPVLDVFRPKAIAQQHIILQINLCGCQIISGSQVTRKRGGMLLFLSDGSSFTHNFESLPGE
jgi:hypothetical protein